MPTYFDRSRLVHLCLLVILGLLLNSAHRALPLAGVASAAGGEDRPQPSTAPAQSPPTPTAQSGGRSQTGSAAAWAEWSALPLADQAKVDPRILSELRGEVSPAHVGKATLSAPAGQASSPAPRPYTRFLVYLRASADLARLDQRIHASQADRRAALVEMLRATAEESQAGVRRLLGERSAARSGDTPSVSAFQPFFIVNALAVEGDLSALVALAQQSEVSRIVANYPLQPILKEAELTGGGDEAGRAGETRKYEWNLLKVQANRVHTELSIRGAGAVVGGFDTGVNYSHPALLRQYRGNNNGVIDHNYNWFVPDGVLYANGNLGPSVTTTPSDCAYSSHGTHTMGTMVGEASGNVSVIGMAPDARWIALPGICADTMPGGIRDDIGGIKAFQWFLCPTDLTGVLATADCSKAPDVVNSSWGSANPADDTFRPIVQVLAAAGVAPVFAAGNPYAGPGSIGAPANIPEAITVGATTESDALAYFSAQGPSFYPGEQKPELSAPGDYVRSAVGASGYDSYSGTSMAAPHMAGLIALLVAADLQDGVRDFDVKDMERLMILSAEDLGDPGPDNQFGHGRIDAYAAVQMGLSAGDLRGTIFDAEYNRPVPAVFIEAFQPATARRFTAQADATGVYSLTLPAGEYQITLSRWGYETTEVGSHLVVAGALSLIDFRLLSRPQAVVSGVVRDESGPVADALIYAANHPATQARSGRDGTYQISLPLGANELVIQAAKHRLARQSVQTPGVGTTLNITLKKAPSILLVDTSPLGGWFLGWPVYRFYTRALETEKYQYDLWRIQFRNFTDTQAGADGSTLYGLPSAATLKRYDLVIWVQSYCNDEQCITNSPVEIGAEPALLNYLDGGGRLFISGQDLAYADRSSILFNGYLQADYVSNYGGYEGMELKPSSFLSGLNLRLTNGSLYGYANGVFYYSPDAVAPRAGGYAFPILEYSNSSESAAALAVAPCNAPYRAIFLAAGLENLAPRAGQPPTDWTKMLDTSITWLVGSSRETGYSVSGGEEEGSGLPGEKVSYRFSIVNRGDQPLRFSLSLNENQWPTQILHNGLPIGSVVDLPGCSSVAFDLLVEVPYSAPVGQEDRATLGVSVTNRPGQPTYQRAFRTRHMPQWSAAEGLPANRYGMSTFSQATTFHIVGGSTSDGFESATTEHLRFDPCIARWENRAPLPEPRMFAASVGIGDRFFVAGGFASFGSNVTSDSLFIYDSRTDSWSQGAPMPRPLYWATGAAVDGKFYLFGGTDGLENSTNFYVYDPATNQWQDKGPAEWGERVSATSAVYNGEIYLLGGFSYNFGFIRYNPATNTWTELSLPSGRRFGAALVAAPDGFFYFLGGEGSSTVVERYDPVRGVWEIVNYTLGYNRWWPAAAYVEGRIYLAGGVSEGLTHESLRLAGSLCESALRDQQTAVDVNGDILYTVDIATSDQEQPNAHLIAPLHPNQNFVGFTQHLAGAVYTAGHAVEWRGRIPANGPPLRLAYAASMKPGAWQAGDRITHTVQLDNGSGRALSRSTAAQLFASDFAASQKEVSSLSVAASTPFTYTIHLRSYTPVGGFVSFSDPLPATLDFVSGTLTSSAAHYNASTHTIHWSGNVWEGNPGYANLSNEYLWADSLGAGHFPSPVFAWQDIRRTGASVVTGQSSIVCALPIGFAFPFYGSSYTQVCVDVNGTLLLGESDASSSSYNNCPMPGYSFARIAGLWSSLAVKDGVYMQTFGQSPQRYTIFQWTDAHYWDIWDEYYGIARAADTDFQIVLHEDGRLQLHILRMGTSVRQRSTTGLSGPLGNQTLTYQCNRSRSGLTDQMAVAFLPPGGVTNTPSEALSFQVAAKPTTPLNSVVTNTVTIQSGAESYTRTATLLVQSVDLSASVKRASRTDLLPGESVTYTITVSNRGLAPARQTTLSDALPAGLTFSPGSLSCNQGICAENGGVIAWQGSLPPGDNLTVTYSATLTAVLPDRTALTNTVRINGIGLPELRRSAVVYARGTSLSASRFSFGNRPIEPGDRFTLSALLRNTGIQNANATFALTLPTELAYIPNTLRCGIGNCRMDGGTRILWDGIVAPRGLVAVQMDVQLAQGLTSGQRIRLSGEMTDSTWGQSQPVMGDMFVAVHIFMPRLGDGKRPPLFLPIVGGQAYDPFGFATPTPASIFASPITTPEPTPTPSGP